MLVFNMGQYCIYKGEISQELLFGFLMVNYFLREVKVGGGNILFLDNVLGGFVDIFQLEDLGLFVFDVFFVELFLDCFCFIFIISVFEIGLFRGFLLILVDLYIDVLDNDVVIVSG